MSVPSTSTTNDIGDAVRLWAVFRTEAGAQAAPTSVTLIVRDPSGTDTTVSNSAGESGDGAIASAAIVAAGGAALVDETGLYKATVTPDVAGWYWYEWTGAGAVVETQPGWFEVRRRRVGDPA